MLNFLQNQKLIYFNLFILISFLVFGISNAQRYGQFQNPELVSLFKDWRAFEVPPMKNGVPDYSEASFNQRWETYTVLRE